MHARRSSAVRTWARWKVALKRRPLARRLYAWFEWSGNRGRLWYQARVDGRRPPPADGFPLPPPRLRYRVHGRADQASFLRVGSVCAADILSVLGARGLEPPPGGTVLDFGCGCGRVLRNLLLTRPEWRCTGIDIDDEAIAWCRAAYPGATFETTPSWPPIALPAASFDLIIGISVFSHLDEDYQTVWLRELGRLVKPGGSILVSVRGEREQGMLPDEDRARLLRDGFLYKSWRTGRLKLDGLPEFYQTAYHLREYVEREWSHHLKVVDYLPSRINRHHDAVLLSGPGRSA